MGAIVSEVRAADGSDGSELDPVAAGSPDPVLPPPSADRRLLDIPFATSRLSLRDLAEPPGLPDVWLSSPMAEACHDRRAERSPRDRAPHYFSPEPNSAREPLTTTLPAYLQQGWPSNDEKYDYKPADRIISDVVSMAEAVAKKLGRGGLARGLELVELFSSRENSWRMGLHYALGEAATAIATPIADGVVNSLLWSVGEGAIAGGLAGGSAYGWALTLTSLGAFAVSTVVLTAVIEIVIEGYFDPDSMYIKSLNKFLVDAPPSAFSMMDGLNGPW